MRRKVVLTLLVVCVVLLTGWVVANAGDISNLLALDPGGGGDGPP